MSIICKRFGMAALMLGALFPCRTFAQESAASPAAPQAAPKQGHNNVRKAIRWKQFDYTCEGGAKLTVYLADQLAKIRYGDKAYLMRQTVSADGNRYSDGRVVWWGKGDGGFLQEDQQDGNGKKILEGCTLDKPLNSATVTGSVSYLQRVALPPNAVI
jgi:membrane-bound inhibitor of C-type lysozyme